MHSFRLGIEAGSSTDYLQYMNSPEVIYHFYRPGLFASYEFIPIKFISVDVMVGYDFTDTKEFDYNNGGRWVLSEPIYTYYSESVQTFSYKRFKVIPSIKYTFYRNKISSFYLKGGVGFVQVDEDRVRFSTVERYTTDSIFDYEESVTDFSDNCIRFPFRFQLGLQLPVNTINTNQGVDLFMYYEGLMPSDRWYIDNRSIGIGLAYCFDFK